MNEILAQTRTFYEALSNGQRLGLLASIVASILAIVGVVWWSSVESYSTIYTGSSGELHAVTEDLNEAGIPYRISRDGNQVQVPTSQKGEAMIAAAMSNHTEGLEILKGIDMGTSPSMEREYRTRALELELQKTLNSLTEIQGSRVHIVPLNRISFIGQEKQASASVTIQTGGALSGRQIKGIVRLVSGAVHGLNPQDVTLTDEEGQLLHPEPGAEKDDLISASSSLIELAAQREQAMASALISAAARVLGSPDHIWANVRLDIQQSQMQRTKNLFDPESQVVKSEEVNEERSQSNEPAQGIPGAENNLPEQAPAPAPGDQTESNSITTNYENGTIQEVESIPAGEIRRINAAVSFNQEAVAELATRSGKSEDEIRASLQKLVETSLGTDKTRGDVVAVEFLPFPEMEDLEEGGGLSTMTYIVEGYLPSAIALLAVLLFFFMVARPIVTTITKISVPRPKDEKEEDSEDPANIPADTTDPDLLMERMRHLVDNFEAVDARDLNRLTQMHEDPAASVLRRWLKAS